MKMHFICSLVLSILTTACHADSWDEALRKRIDELKPIAATNYLITKDIIEANDEQAAVSAFSWGGPTNARMIVGGALRAYTENPGYTGVWGADIGAYNSLYSGAQLVGVEVGTYQRNHANVQGAVGVNIIFGNRAGVSQPPLGVGENKYNFRTQALMISAQSRSPAGEYSGWNRVLKVDDFAMDRTVERSYATIIEAGKVHTDTAWYLVTYPCGAWRCGLRPAERGLELWRDIDGVPTLYRIL